MSGTFQDDLWDGYDAVVERVEAGLQMNRTVGAFFKRYAEAEAAYGKKQGSLNKDDAATRMKKMRRDMVDSVKRKGGDRVAFQGTVDGAWKTVQEQFTGIADARKRNAANVIENIHQTLMASIKQRDTERRALLVLGDKADRAIKALETQMLEHKAAYFKAMNDNIDGTESEGQYRQSLAALNEQRREHYDQVMPGILADFETMELQRGEDLKAAIAAFCDTLSAPPPVIEAAVGTLDQTLADADADTDVRTFAEALRTGYDRPGDVAFAAADAAADDAAGAEEGGGGGGRRLRLPFGRPKPLIYGHPEVSPLRDAPEGEEGGSGGQWVAEPVAAAGAGEGAAPPPAGGAGGVAEIPEGGAQARVLFDYEAQEDTEVSVKEGQIITIMSQDNASGWSSILVDESDDERFIPANYYELV